MLKKIRMKKKEQTFYKRNQVKNPKLKEKWSNLKPKQNKRKNNISMLDDENEKKIQFEKSP
jgi:hypothetical protein